MINTKTLMKGFMVTTAMSLFAAGNAYAAGTTAGTDVQNTFSLDYQVNSVVQPTIDNTATPTQFTVDRKIDLTVVSAGNLTTTPGATAQNLFYTVTNNGNDNQAYSMAAANETTDNFDPLAVPALAISWYKPALPTDPCSTTVADYSSTGNTTDLAPDEKICAMITGDMPTTPLDGDQAAVTLVATTLVPDAYINGAGDAGNPVETGDQASTPTGTNTMTDATPYNATDNVFVDGVGVATQEAVEDGKHAATGTYIIASANLAATKAVNIISHGRHGLYGSNNAYRRDYRPVPGTRCLCGICHYCYELRFSFSN